MAVTINGAGTITGLTSATLPQVNASTQVLIGGPITSTYTKGLQAFGTSGGANGSAADLMSWRYSADTVGGQLGLYKTRGTTALDTSVPVVTNDTLGAVTFYGSTGSGMAAFAAITGFVDGTVNTTPTLATAISITTGSTAATERMRVNSSGEVSIQKSLLVGGPNTSTNTHGLQLYGTTNATGSTSSSVMYRWSPDIGGPNVNFFKTRGTSATDLSAGSVVASGDILGAVNFGGSDGSGANITRGAFTGFVDGAVSAGNLPTAFSITTGTTSGSERMRITSAGLMGIGTGTPASCAIVDVTSTTKGFKFPVMTTTERNLIGTPVAGLVIFDSTLAKLCVYTGSAWERITSAV
jgi:hypothetical protein